MTSNVITVKETGERHHPNKSSLKDVLKQLTTFRDSDQERFPLENLEGVLKQLASFHDSDGAGFLLESLSQLLDVKAFANHNQSGTRQFDIDKADDPTRALVEQYVKSTAEDKDDFSSILQQTSSEWV